MRNHWKPLRKYLNENNITYEQYLAPEHWQDVRKRYWKSKLHKGGCYCCGAKNKPLQLHHKTYKRIGKERLNDLLLLCKDCHKAAHDLLNSGWPGVLYGAAKRIKKNIRAQDARR